VLLLKLFFLGGGVVLRICLRVDKIYLVDKIKQTFGTFEVIKCYILLIQLTALKSCSDRRGTAAEK
jgi:hypothetical protein